MKPRIKCSNNGPLIVDGLTNLARIGSDTVYETKDTVALCRCGKSANKPFCDGAHWDTEFDEDAKQG